MPEPEKGRSSDAVAHLFGVSGRYVQYGKSINEKLPDRDEQIRQGNLTITYIHIPYISDFWFEKNINNWVNKSI